MRKVTRTSLNARTIRMLSRRQTDVNAKAATGRLDEQIVWDASIKTRYIQDSLSALKAMAGPRERCMYCVDSEGAEIDHFWPKSHYHQHMFVWNNFLLCCGVCNKKKSDKFPLTNGTPLLIDPSMENPWDSLDFDPTTGNFSARYDPIANAPNPKGVQTVDIFQLDRREGVSSGYLRSLKRISDQITAFFVHPTQPVPDLIRKLEQDDEHGLLVWCFNGLGSQIAPFCNLRTSHPTVWMACCSAFPS